jgi:hypothetical protein
LVVSESAFPQVRHFSSLASFWAIGIETSQLQPKNGDGRPFLFDNLLLLNGSSPTGSDQLPKFDFNAGGLSDPDALKE